MHLKRLSMPRYWGLRPKQETFVVRPRGPHPQQFSIPLQVLVRDVLKLAATRTEAGKVLNAKKVLVDKKPKKDGKLAVGLMDIIEIPDLKKTYRVEVDHKGLVLKEVKEAGQKLVKIIGKTKVKGGKLQLNCHDGRNLLVDSTEYKVGDTLAISLPDQKVMSHFPLKDGSLALILKGRNQGVKGTIKSLSSRKYMMEKATATLEADGQSIDTLRDYVFVIGKV